MSPRVRIVVVDDHPLFREGLRFILEGAADLEVVAEVDDGLAALAAVEERRPDVVLMDLAMPRLDGLEAMRRMPAGTAVLVLTMYDDDANVLTALQAGARGYLVKGAGPDEVLSAVRAVARGNAVFGAALATRMLDVLGSRPAPARSERFPELSPREHEVLEHLAEGRTNQQIADLLFISPITVRNHVSNILAKLQLTDRRQVMLRARRGSDPSE
jgi:DNA-binding NarL/FixJ family response regulator